ncbi:uncharacterized protein V6R79_026409 [Siganus canaliculatus]
MKVSEHQRSSQRLFSSRQSTMNPRLTENQQKTLSSQLGGVRLKLLYKASVHGFTGAAFHQRCDNRSPTVSVGYNYSDFVFGGFTKQPFSQSEQYVHDDQAFLFSFSGENLRKHPVTSAAVKRMGTRGPQFGRAVCGYDDYRLDEQEFDRLSIHYKSYEASANRSGSTTVHKYPVTSAACAVRMVRNSGPYFGEDLVLVNGNKPVVRSSPGHYYNFPAAEMHGNDLSLTECEVYQVEETTKPERPWRPVTWKPEKRQELMETIKSYKPTVSSVSQIRVLLIGPVGAGKSSFFNSVNSVFRGHVTSQAISGSAATSLTTQFRTYSVKTGREGKPLPIIFCDTMGLEENTGAGLAIDDISSVLGGHVPDRYQFNPSAPIHLETHGYQRSPQLQDRIHCVAYVIDACKVSIMPKKLEEKLGAIRKKVNLLGVPQLVLLTKVDEACPSVKEDLTNIYKSSYIRQMIEEASARVGVPLSCVVPVKNYSEELDLDLNCDILLLSVIIQMLRFTDNYFDDISDREEKKHGQTPEKYLRAV